LYYIASRPCLEQAKKRTKTKKKEGEALWGKAPPLDI
jgi:hypothetical protein